MVRLSKAASWRSTCGTRSRLRIAEFRSRGHGGISLPGIYKALGEDGNPSFETIRSMLGAMGLRLTVEPAQRT